MLLGGTKRHLRTPHAVAITRDVIEILAIVIAGVWAFYVFAYENRIKPSLAQPDVNLSASIERLSERNGLIAVGLRMEFHNVGTVKAHFLGVAVNVYGQRILPRKTAAHPDCGGLSCEFAGFYRVGARVPVYSYAYITRLGNPATGQDTEIDPGTTIANYRTFYVPAGRFDLLTVGIDAPYTKYDERTIPTRLVVGYRGDVKVVTHLTPDIQQYNILPVSSLDIR